jgi:hypothetical protein
MLRMSAVVCPFSRYMVSIVSARLVPISCPAGGGGGGRQRGRTGICGQREKGRNQYYVLAFFSALLEFSEKLKYFLKL